MYTSPSYSWSPSLAPSDSWSWTPSAASITYVEVPTNLTSCLVNIVQSGDPPKPTSVLADSNGTFLINHHGNFMPAESPLCLPYTNENCQTITVNNYGRDWSYKTKTHWEYPSSPGSYRTYYSYTPGQSFSAGEIAGIAIGSVAGLAMIVAAAVFCLCRRRKRKAKAAAAGPGQAVNLSTIEYYGAQDVVPRYRSPSYHSTEPLAEPSPTKKNGNERFSNASTVAKRSVDSDEARSSKGWM